MPSFRLYLRSAGVASLGAAVAVTLAACGSSSSSADKTTAAAPTGTSSPATTSAAGTSAATSAAAASSAGTTAATGAKAEFITKAEALCGATAEKAKTVPQPSGPSDFAAIQTYTSSVLEMAPAFYADMTTLAADSPDNAELTSKWIAVEKADFAIAGPLLERLGQAAAAKNATLTGQLFTSIGGLPDNSAKVGAFLNSYGMPVCAKFESS